MDASSNTTSAEQEVLLRRKREKRKRVQRIKSGIIAFIVIYILASIVTLFVLSISVSSMQRQINDLSEKVSKLEAVKATRKPTIIDSVEPQSDILVVDTKTAEANLAGEKDTLKVYLTFDDGPSSYTNRILDILDDYGVKATFFVVGKTDEDSRIAMKRIVNEGHTIGLHSFTHKYSELYASKEAFAADFEKIRKYVYDVTGIDSKYYRFPGGSSNSVSATDMSELIKFLNEKNMTYFDWNVANGDETSNDYTVEELIENVMNDVVKYKTSVVLMHEAADKGRTVESLPRLIELLQQKGALILPISRDTTVIQHVKLAQGE